MLLSWVANPKFRSGVARTTARATLRTAWPRIRPVSEKKLREEHAPEELLHDGIDEREPRYDEYVRARLRFI